MELVQLYSNQDEHFTPIRFNNDVSVILAEIRLPENQDIDVHNLGKSTFGELLDFCLLKGKSARSFLFSEDQFKGFVFYLEVILDSGDYLTIRRPVDPGTKVSLLIAKQSSDARGTNAESWNHSDLAFDRARTALDGYLGIDFLQPWPFRKLVGYLLRSQADYNDVFKLGKFSGKHRDWKPFVAHLLGLDSASAQDLYDHRESLKEAESHLGSIVSEWGDEVEEPSLLDGLISVKRREVNETQNVLDTFDFSEEDKRVTQTVVEDIESRIAAANEDRYRLGQLIQRIDESLEQEQILFKPSDSEKLFREAGVVLGDQVRRGFDQLIAFNRAIGTERREALTAQRDDAEGQLAGIDAALGELNQRQAEALSFLRNSHALDKYKDITRSLTDQRTHLATLERQREAASRLAELRRDVREQRERVGQLETTVEQNIADVSGDDNSRFGTLRAYFDEIIHAVVGTHALIAVSLNSKGGMEFSAEFIGETGDATSEGSGTTYQKLLSVAFDLALLRTFVDQPFPRFVFHDGAFEQLEQRKQAKLLEVFREYSGHGLQPIVTALDRDLPDQGSPSVLTSKETILVLHDEGQDGRLFKMPPW